MPPKYVRTVRQLIYWEYAKLIAGRAVGDRKNFRFVTYTFKKLDGGQINPAAIMREQELLLKGDRICAYCEETSGDLQLEHIIPKSRGGLDMADNTVLACRGCNTSKSALDLLEWYDKQQRTDEIPRLVLGKYLKLVFAYHEREGTLDAADLNADGKLNLYDLGALFAPTRHKAVRA